MRQAFSRRYTCPVTCVLRAHTEHARSAFAAGIGQVSRPVTTLSPMSAFSDLAAIAPQTLSAGYLARTVHGERITFAVVEIEPHAELAEHSHENEQLGMVIEGSVSFRVGDEQRTVAAGGIWRIPAHKPHLVRGGDRGAVVVDVFTPAREEWKSLQAQEPAAPRWP
jgi:quercetin dioxygenase-like cupin family protein